MTAVYNCSYAIRHIFAITFVHTRAHSLLLTIQAKTCAYSHIPVHIRACPRVFAHIYPLTPRHTRAHPFILAYTRAYLALEYAVSGVALPPYSLSIELLLTFHSSSTGRARSRVVLPGTNDAETSTFLPKRSTSRAISLPSSACRVSQGPELADHAHRGAAVHDSETGPHCHLAYRASLLVDFRAVAVRNGLQHVEVLRGLRACILKTVFLEPWAVNGCGGSASCGLMLASKGQAPEVS